MRFLEESVADLAESVRNRKVSARELVQHALDRIDDLDDELNAFVAVDGDAALAAAHALDERIAAGEDVGDLAGIPIGVKDNEEAAGFPTTHGSPAWASSPPAPADSLLVTRLRAAGCIVVGKTNLPECAWSPDTVNSVFGPTRNPWDLERSAGGSSGGSAAAVAAGLVPLATGSDGGGSIRIPSALCGLSGFKPSLGRVPGAGPHAWHDLSTSGPMARRVDDIALALDAVIGPDPADLRSLPMPEPSWLAAVDRPHVPLKVAWSPTLGYAPVDDEVRAVCESALRVLERLGADVVEVGGVFPEDPVRGWSTLTGGYLLRTIGPFEGTEVWDLLDPGLRAMVLWAKTLSVADFVRAEDQCYELNRRLVHLFHEVRLLVTPTVAAQTPRVGEQGSVNGRPEVNWVRFTYPFNMTRSPAGTVCVGCTDAGMPVGLQLVGPQHGDMVVLRAMAALEAALEVDRVPNLLRDAGIPPAVP